MARKSIQVGDVLPMDRADIDKDLRHAKCKLREAIHCDAKEETDAYIHDGMKNISGEYKCRLVSHEYVIPVNTEFKLAKILMCQFVQFPFRISLKDV